MPKVKAIVVDIDGTLTDMSRLISLEAIGAMRKMPIPVILCSGNVICFMRAASKLLGASDIMIGENGGVIQVGYDGKPMVLADIEECRKAVESIKKVFPGLEVLDNRYRLSELALRRNIDVVLAREIVARDFPGLEIVDTGFALHLKHRSVNKGTALKKVAEILDIPPVEFAAMGDSENDIHMFETAGVKIAVANATPNVKTAADYVTQKSFGEGAAEGFEWLKTRL